MAENDFKRQQQNAVDEMRQMNSRAKNNYSEMPPVPPFVKIPNNHQAPFNEPQPTEEKEEENKNQDNTNTNQQNKSKPFDLFSIFDGLDIPFLDKFKNDGDLPIILGLLLILLSEKADKKLLLALAYILL